MASRCLKQLLVPEQCSKILMQNELYVKANPACLFTGVLIQSDKRTQNESQSDFQIGS